MRSEAISAKTRKLKAQWTPEFAQDLNAYHSLDAEAELTSMLSEYISLEIDLEILDMLIENAPTVEYWSAKVGNQINAQGTGFDANVSGVYYTQMSWQWSWHNHYASNDATPQIIWSMHTSFFKCFSPSLSVSPNNPYFLTSNPCLKQS